MADTKKEHYVPRFYLKEFCDDSDGKIWVYDKRNGQSRKQRISEIAMENYFYDLDLDKIEIDPNKEAEFQKVTDELVEKGKFEDFEQMKEFLKKYIEKDYFFKIEPLFSKLLMDVTEKATRANRWYIQNCYAFSMNEKKMLSIMFANQLIRTKSMREEQKDAFEKATAAIYNKIFKDKDKSDISVKIDNESSKWQHLSMILDPEFLETMSNILNSHIWVMYINRTSKSFFTSDNPIAKIPNVTELHKGNMGVGSEGMELLFPVNPNLTIGMYEKNHFEKKMIDRMFIEINDTDLIDRFNIAQIMNSYRCVFSNNKDFWLIKKILNENPFLREFNSNISVS